MPNGDLSDREIQCLYLAGRLGLSNDEIAYRLSINPKRVAKVLSTAYRKLGVHNRRQAYQRGVLDPGLSIPLEDQITLASDWSRPVETASVEADTRPWLARHWHPPPSGRLMILGLILGSAILIAALILGAVGIVNSVFDATQNLGRHFT